jgi:hypothetical protein
LNTPSKDAQGLFPFASTECGEPGRNLKEFFRGRRLRWIQKQPGIKFLLKTEGFQFNNIDSSGL